VAAIATMVATVVSVQPKLSDARDRVDARWTPLRAPLATRYDALAKVGQAFATAGAASRTVTKDLDAQLRHWQQLAALGDAHAQPDAEAGAANDLEALARRARANFAASDKLKTDKGIAAAFATFDQSVPPAGAITAYNAAVRSYEHERTGTMHRLVASVFGYGDRPALVLGT
jgi:hypothetical protein